MSRNKGSRNERLLVEHLKKKGYGALRVPLSGAMKGYDFDVVVEGMPEMTFELKVRANEYASIYHLFKEKSINGVVRVSTPGSETLVMSDDIEKARDLAGEYPLDESRTVKKLFNMRKLLKGARFLVIRGDRQGFLFIQFGR